jgi:precorrin-6B methylase 2
MKSGALSALKSKLFSNESRVRRVLFGLLKGQLLDINLHNQSQVYFGLWERETYGAIRRASRSAKWFVDIGAGRGELCVFFATLPGVSRVIAIEPSNVETNGLVANLKHNNIVRGRVEVLTKFVGTKRDPGYVEIDQLGLNQSACGFIKIDVDGSELDVLQSGKKVLSEGNVELLVETHSVDLEKVCIEWLQGHGYTCSIIRNAWWRSVIPEQRPIVHNRWFFAARRAS